MDKNQQLVPAKKESDFDNLVRLRQNISVYMAARNELGEKKSSLNRQKNSLKAQTTEYTDKEKYMEKHGNLKKKTAYHTIWDSLYNLLYYNEGVIPGIIFAIIGALVTLYIGFKKFDAFSTLRTGIFCLTIGICIGVLIFHLIKSIHEPLWDWLDDIFSCDSRQYRYDRRYERKFDKIYKKSKKARATQVTALNNCIFQIDNSIAVIDTQIRNLDKAFYSLKFNILPEDYKYTDYILFLFSSGRVDTLKEALLSVDAERRAQSIVNSISSLSEKMSRAVTTVCSRIDKLSSQINQNSNKMFLELNNINKNMSSLQCSMSKELRNISATVSNSISSLDSSISSISGELSSAANSINGSLSGISDLLARGNQLTSACIPSSHVVPI